MGRPDGDERSRGSRRLRGVAYWVPVGVVSVVLVVATFAGLAWAGISVWGWRQGHEASGSVQRLYNRWKPGVVRVHGCNHASDEERSVSDIYACDVSSTDARVFDLNPPPKVQAGMATLCFDVSGKAYFFGVPAGHGVCEQATGPSAIYPE